jgi:aspartate/methionine/tyrosine aminotransferase
MLEICYRVLLPLVSGVFFTGMYLWAQLPPCSSKGASSTENTPSATNGGGTSALQPQHSTKQLAADPESSHSSEESAQQHNEGSHGNSKACSLVMGGDDVAFCRQLIADTGVSLGPGSGFGPGGAGYVRFALVAPEERLTEAARRIGKWLASLQ